MLAEGTPVEVTPVQAAAHGLARAAAFGMWRDRDDLGDSAEAARKLRERSERREDR
jgi:PHD/YefM family antitoxin component YafN of YafNO toxin-antitoxin module